MQLFTKALMASVALGSVAGWLSADGGVGALRKDQTAWSLPARPETGDAERMRLYAALMSTNHFGAETNTSGETNDDKQESGAQPPRIAGAWITDGKTALSFQGSDGKYFTAGVGDVLPGGWTVQGASLETVTVERNGEILDLTVFPYDKPGT